MARTRAVFFIGAMGLAAFAIAAPVDARPDVSATTDARPTSDEKRCKASRRRVERQQEVIAEAQARVEREKAARATCRTKRSCDSLDRALKASQVRSERHAKQLAQFESEAGKACAGAPRPALSTNEDRGHDEADDDGAEQEEIAQAQHGSACEHA